MQKMAKRKIRSTGAISEIELYTISAFIKRLGICRNSLAAMRKRGLPVHFMDGRKLIIDGKEAIAWFRSQWAETLDNE
jgi:hypothetical protein